jgi:hypothetical protein
VRTEEIKVEGKRQKAKNKEGKRKTDMDRQDILDCWNGKQKTQHHADLKP